MEELELLKEHRKRVGLVIHARWALLVILAAYGLIASFLFRDKSADLEPLTTVHVIAPVAAVLFVAAYNALFHMSYRWISQIRSLNQVQLLFDLILVTVVVHFSGGAVSWFWTMYLVITLEGALIMDKKSDIYAIALGGVIAFGGLLTFEYHGIIPPVPMPFENNALQHIYSYEMIKWGWVSITNFSVAFVGVFLMEMVRQREARLRDMVVKDDLTDLYNRRYFFYRLHSEIQRAKRYGRTLSLLFLDVDDFKKFNDAHGHLAGDDLLRSLAEILRASIRRSDEKPSYEVDIACRYGGEEFVIILPRGGLRTGGSRRGASPPQCRDEGGACRGRADPEACRDGPEGRGARNGEHRRGVLPRARRQDRNPDQGGGRRRVPRQTVGEKPCRCGGWCRDGSNASGGSRWIGKRSSSIALPCSAGW